MIFLVPISPEVPPKQRPRLWQGLLMCVLLGAAFLISQPLFDHDLDYVLDMPNGFAQSGELPPTEILDGYLKNRPLLKVSPARLEWDLKRLIAANFLHESFAHLALNLIGIFAGMRITSCFIPFGLSFAIFLMGGSFGLLLSIWLSQEPSGYIPHLGASAGLFALMGTYYAYNFRYRTRYFFWLPSRVGHISLRTSWFFFLDALMLELVLSVAQLFPNRIDTVDHIAHVSGFAAGLFLATALRWVERWPSYLQVREEFIHWRNRYRRSVFYEDKGAKWTLFLELLKINPYNDQVKLILCREFAAAKQAVPPESVNELFSHFSPTFIRLHTDAVALMIDSLHAQGTDLPQTWLQRTPYDSIIRLARQLASPDNSHDSLLLLVSQYRRTHPEGGDIERKLELLSQKLVGFASPDNQKNVV